jgi:hypothetical protein
LKKEEEEESHTGGVLEEEVEVALDEKGPAPVMVAVARAVAAVGVSQMGMACTVFRVGTVR